MLNALRLVAQVLLGVALLEVALGALSPLTSNLLARQAVDPALIGVIISAYFAGFLAGTLTSHHAIDRVGHIRAFSVFAVIAANAALLHVVLNNPYAWVVLRAVLGYGMAGVFVIVESWLNDKATTETRGRIFALYTAVAWSAGALGPLGLNIPDPSGTIMFCLIAVVMGSAIIPLALTKVHNPEIGHRTHFGIRQLYKVSPTGVFACFASGLVNTALYGLLPVYMVQTGHSAAQLSILLSISYLAPLVFQYPIGWLADRFGRRPMMLITTLIAIGLSTTIVNLPSGAFTLLVLLTFLLTSAISPLYGLGVGQTSDYIEKKDFVAASAGLLFAWGVGSSIGPAVAAPAMRWFGGNGLFYFVTACHVLLASFIAYRMLMRRALATKEQGNFVAVPITQGTYGAPELDPRSEPSPTPATASKAVAAAVD
jgi:MFS family permease